MLVSLIAAIVAAVLYGVASVMQAIAVRAATPYNTAATMAAIRLTSTAHLPRSPG